ncbi:MAG: hypothetical protein JWM19_975 [Actinomycetia bacterium]|nr:hypothetical protein [Actinomycetes bacterium]
MTTPDDPAEALRVLGSFIRPLPPGELEKRTSAYSGPGGSLSRDDMILSLLELDAGWY